MEFTEEHGYRFTHIAYVGEISVGTCSARRRTNVVKWMLELDFYCNGLTVQLACRAGDLELVKILMKKGIPRSSLSLQLAITGGHLDIVKLIWNRGRYLSNAAPLIDAVEHNHLDIVEWLWDNGCAQYHEVFVAAVQRGNLQIIDWLWAHGCPTPEWIASKATTEPVLEWLWDKGFKFEGSLIYLAAIRKDFETVKWLWTKGCPCVSGTLRTIVRACPGEVARWLRDHPRRN